MKNLWFLFIVTFNSAAFSQYNSGAKLTGMGYSGTAVQDPWVAQFNPAGITFLTKPALSLSYAKHLFSNEVSSQGVAVVVPIDDNVVGLNFQRYGFSAYRENKIGLTYARKFGPHLSFGLNTNYQEISIPNYGTTNGFSVDFGAQYKFNKYFILGANINNLARQKYANNDIDDIIPTCFSIGLSYHASDKVLIATTVVKELNQLINVQVGLDYKLIELFSLRGGINARPFKQFAGFGIYYKKFMVDMATIYDANLGYAPQISLGYAF
ncbi:PorV/PorQ family protein [Pedobacter sandarakinus]|uniref:hypothetical protein n=1 Tax=Pedobacter sandarakinus TaxID=353156 RepID=UPI0022481891|nr:hypothetical protein [Pedobacter sandarakinus]MCX2574267.1 hypothetical protein [Pedobacter sandarakinus]